MDSRASTDRYSRLYGVCIDGCSHLYIGYIEISLEEDVASISSFRKEGYLIVAEAKPRSTTQSPLELPSEVDPI